MDPSLVAALLGSLVPLSLIAGAFVTYLIRRRGASGQIATSDAATLWAQSQGMITQLIAEKTKAEEQRDRLIKIQSEQVVPALAAVNGSLTQIMAVITMVLDRLPEGTPDHGPA
jgi:hypothetical protein